jgi:hypothetical protein
VHKAKSKQASFEFAAVFAIRWADWKVVKALNKAPQQDVDPG